MRKSFILFLAFGLALSAYSGVGEPKFDHSQWTYLLNKYVSESGNVDYQGLKTDQAKLDSYLKKLQTSSPESDWTKHEKMAYWINAYNAFTIKLILKNMPLKSIMEVNGGKAWDLAFIELNGKMLSLNNIEHDILRAKYKDPRIHFAVNCASISCPKLRNEAFTANELEVQLEEMAKGFVNNPTKNKIQANAIRISKLFDWYKADFTKGGDLKTYLNTYSKTKISPNATVNFMEYNWNLNSK